MLKLAPLDAEALASVGAFALGRPESLKLMPQEAAKPGIT